LPTKRERTHSDKPHSDGWLNRKKSAEAIVPETGRAEQ